MKIVIDRERVNIILIIFAVLLLFSVFYSSTKGGGGELYYGLFLTCFILIFLLKKHYPMLSFFKHNTLFTILLIFVCFITTFVYDQGGSYVRRMGQLTFFIISILLGYYCFYMGQSKCIDICFKLVNVLVFISSILAVIEYFFAVYFGKVFLYSNYINTGRLASIFSHPVTFASMLLYGIFYVILYKKNNIVKAICLLLYFFCLYRTLSRSSWLACMITLFFIFFLSRKFSLRTLVLCLFLFACLILFSNSNIGKSVISVVYSRVKETEDSVSLNQRLGTIIYFYNKTFKNSNLFRILFGHGERASKDVMLSIKIITANFGTTDNSYIQLLYNYGLVMMLGFFYYEAKFIKNIFLLRREETQLEWLLLPQCMSAFFFEITENHAVGFVFLFMLGAWLCKESMEKLR